MFNFREIEKNNRSTFYDYRTGEKKSVLFRLVTIGALSALFASMMGTETSGFLSAVLAVESILVGFSFSVLFFLLSGNNSISVDPNVLEDKLTDKKLKRLSKEIFHNVSYFNMVSVGCVALALALLFPSIDFFELVKSNMPSSIAKNVLAISKYLLAIVQWTLWWAFYFLLLESIYTFVRTVGRVTYYFDKKMSHVFEQESP